MTVSPWESCVDDFTLEAWIKPAGPFTTVTTIVSSGSRGLAIDSKGRPLFWTRKALSSGSTPLSLVCLTCTVRFQSCVGRENWGQCGCHYRLGHGAEYSPSLFPQTFPVAVVE